MKKSSRISIAVLAVTIIAIVLSVLFLPESVRVQGSVKTGVTTYLPKLWAILLATALNVSGVIGMLVSSKEAPKKYYPLILSVLGVILFAYMLIANCLLT